MKLTLSLLLGLVSLASARTDLEGCVSSVVVINYGASYLWYVPDTGEICSFLDCGGGRAPPKSTVPGCPLYTGTATVTPDYIEGWGPNGKQAASTTTIASTASSPSTAAIVTTEAPVSESAATSSPQSTGSSPVTDSAQSASVTTASSATATATASPTFNAANTRASNAGVMALMAAVVGAVAL